MNLNKPVVTLNLFPLEFAAIYALLMQVRLGERNDYEKAVSKIMIDLEYFHEKFLRGKIEITYYKDQPKPKLNQDKFLKLCNKYNLRTFTKSTFITPFESCQS